MFIQSPVDECLSGFQELAIVSSTAGNIPVEGFEHQVSSVFKYLPRDGITGSYGDSLRNGKLFTIVDAPAVYEHYNYSTSSRPFFSFYFLFKKKNSGHPAAAVKSLQSCPTLCDPRDGSPPGSPVPGILQARTLEWVAISFSSA